MSLSPKFCIYGVGAIGGTIAALLARAGADVSVVAHDKTLAALKRDGLRLLMNGDSVTLRIKVSDDPADFGPQDYVIVAVKVPSLPDVAAHIAPLLGPHTAVVTAMNGVPWWFFDASGGALAGKRLTAIDPDGAIERAIPVASVIGCVVYISASVEAPGVIQHAAGRRLIIGEPGARATPRLFLLGDWLRRAGFDCEESADIRRDIWFKLWGNLSTNPISLLTAATLDRIIDDPLVHMLCVRMMKEAARIGEAVGIPAVNSPEEMIAMARKLGPVKTSMLQDAEHHKPVEIDAILTATSDIGRMVGVPTPFIDSVLGLARLRAKELGLLEKAA
jgi:2-dehydropantoate 2-reductase